MCASMTMVSRSASTAIACCCIRLKWCGQSAVRHDLNVPLLPICCRRRRSRQLGDGGAQFGVRDFEVFLRHLAGRVRASPSPSQRYRGYRAMDAKYADALRSTWGCESWGAPSETEGEGGGGVSSAHSDSDDPQRGRSVQRFSELPDVLLSARLMQGVDERDVSVVDHRENYDQALMGILETVASAVRC